MKEKRFFIKDRCHLFFSQNKEIAGCVGKCIKIVLALSVLLFFEAQASLRAQTVSITSASISIADALQKIEKQTGYVFFYPSKILTQRIKTQELSLHLEKASLTESVQQIFKDLEVDFRVEDRTIILSERKNSKDDPSDQVQSQISGTVIDEKGEPLAGANVRIKGTTEQVVTNSKGIFNIQSSRRDVTVLVVYMGYQDSEYRVSGRNQQIIIKLQSTNIELDEVFMIGYGTSTKRLSTGTVQTIGAKEIGSQPNANPLLSLAGRVSGMTVSPSNGLPGSAVNVQIRGDHSLQSGTSPLYIIDGVPFSNDNLNSYGTAGANGGVSPFSTINPADIENISILKDADATAIYGARGANGVVLISTKRGRAGKGTLGVNFYQGAGRVSHYIPMLNTAQYLDLRREAFQNDGITPDESNAPDLTLYDPYAYTDWQKEMIGGTAGVTDAQANFSGGTDQVRFLVNANYRKDGTVFKPDMGSERFGTRLNLDYGNTESRFSAQFSVAFSADRTDLVGQDMTAAYALPPNYPMYNPDGTLYWDAFQENPLAMYKRRYDGLTNTLLLNTTLKFVAAQGLNVKLNVGYNQSTIDQRSAFPTSSYNPMLGMEGGAVFSNGRSSHYIVEPTVDYTLKRDKWNLLLLAGGSWQSTSNKSSTIMGLNYSSEELLGSMAAAGMLIPDFQNDDHYNFNSAFARVNFNVMQRYLLNFNIRKDGSSKFGPNNRFGNFASLGVAWVFSEEQFMKDNLSFLSFGKLRSSFGTTGNDRIENYLYLPMYDTGNIYDQQSALSVTRISNPDIQWESTRKLEFGIDLGFFTDSRVLLTANYYRNRSDNQIIYTQLPSQTGFVSYVENVEATIENTGLEIELSTKNIIKNNFSWTTNFNLTVPRNKLLEFPGLEGSFLSTLYIVGQPVGLQRFYQFDTIDPQSGAPVYQQSADGTQVDFLPGPLTNPWYGGMNNTFTYRDWSLDILMQFSKRNGPINNISAKDYEDVLGAMVNQNTSTLDRWRAPGDSDSLFPGATADPGSDIYAGYYYFNRSTAVTGDNSFIRLKSVNLSYKLQADWVKKLKLSDLNLYAQGLNLLTWMNNKYVFDPEVDGMGVGTMPALRTVVFGINCSF